MRDYVWIMIQRIGGASHDHAYRRGVWSETCALFLLRLKGYRLIQRRYKTPLGEIDLLMAQGSTLIAVEVKYRPHYDAAAYALSTRQQYRIRRSLEQAHKQFPQFFYLRCDTVLIFDDKWPIHMKNVF